MTQHVFRFRVGALACAVFTDGIEFWTEADISGVFPNDSDQILAAFRALPDAPGNRINILYVEL